MSDYISREALLSATDGYDWQAGLKTVLKRLPAADVRPVVYCRDCKDWKRSELTPSHHVCTYVIGAQFVRNADDFCSRGKREES